MTANQAIGKEVSEVFEHLCLGETIDQTEVMFIAPNCMQNKIIGKIEEQIARAKEGQEAYIGAKINSFTDKKIMDKMIEASQAGVKIEMVVRGICCLIPGIPGYTENISIRSIVGRYLEHSRIYIFGDEIYIASADFMTRNTVKRVEAATPIYDEDIKARILKMFRIMLSDDAKARIMNSQGIYERQSREGKEEFLLSQESPYMAYYEDEEDVEADIAAEDEESEEPEEPTEEMLTEEEEPEDVEEAEPAEDSDAVEEPEELEELEDIEEPDTAEEEMVEMTEELLEDIEPAEDLEAAEEEAEDIEEAEPTRRTIPGKRTVWHMDSPKPDQDSKPERTPQAAKSSPPEKRRGLFRKLFYRGRHGS